MFTESGSGDRDCITRMVFAGEDWGGGGSLIFDVYRYISARLKDFHGTVGQMDVFFYCRHIRHIVETL